MICLPLHIKALLTEFVAAPTSVAVQAVQLWLVLQLSVCVRACYGHNAVSGMIHADHDIPMRRQFSSNSAVKSLPAEHTVAIQHHRPFTGLALLV
jgi:hypothetical protein